MLAGKAAEPLWAALVEFAAWPDARLTFKANLLPSAVAAFCLQAADLPDGLLLQAHAGSGIVRGHAGADLTPERAAAMLKGLLATATAAAQGNLIVAALSAGVEGGAAGLGRAARRRLADAPRQGQARPARPVQPRPLPFRRQICRLQTECQSAIGNLPTALDAR